jgi:hypothetical protein
VKVFCDKGAERKFRQEERRAARKVAVGGQRVLEMYHQCQVHIPYNFNRHVAAMVPVPTVSEVSFRAVKFKLYILMRLRPPGSCMRNMRFRLLNSSFGGTGSFGKTLPGTNAAAA